MKIHKWLLLLMVMTIGIAVFSGCGSGEPGSKSGTFSVESSYIQESGEHLGINAEYPVLKGFPGADRLNAAISWN
jgi:hypothetical protein